MKHIPAAIPLLFAAALALLLPRPSPAAPRILVDFVSDAPSAWTPFLKSPRPSNAPSGLSFPLPFAKPNDRAAWDRAFRAPVDLSAPAAFSLLLTCQSPSALRHLGLYFKSGKGWYVSNKPLPLAGPQTLHYFKSDFSVEGTPTGWHRIDAVRLSAWRGPVPADATLVAHRLSTVEGPLLLVRPTTSCPDAASRAVAQTATLRISRLLAEAGIGHSLATDDDLPALLPRARAALLPYNPNPPAAARDALLAFLKRGGKLGVFYSADPDLASSMGFRLGPWLREDRPDQWRQIRALAPVPFGMPPTVHQHSSSIMPAYPATPAARILASWCRADGSPTPQPAIVLSPAGFWMSHILLGDDLTRKRELLTVLCGQLDPDLWQEAARHAARVAGAFPPYLSLPAAVAAIRAQAPASPLPAQTLALLDRATAESTRIASLLEARRWPEAWSAACAQHRLLLRADAACRPPRPGELVGVWDHDGVGLVPGDWPATASRLAALGVNALFVNLAWGGCAHYPSKVVPPSATCRLYGDQLAAARAATRAAGQQLHAWIVLWKLDGAPPDLLATLKKERRLQEKADGTTIPWLSPHHPDNRRLMKDLIGEIATRCPAIDGIHLDYIRLPDLQTDYSPTARARFEAATGKKAAAWPADVRPGGRLHAAFKQWRTDDITSFLLDVRTRLRKIAPSVKLSTAVYGTTDQPDGGSIAQYWPPWLSRGLVDFVVPMDYTESEAEFERLLRTQTSLPNAKGRVIPGIGVTAAESRLDPVQTARQILLARRFGCPGYVLFSLSATLRDETLPDLRQGLTRPAP